MNYLFVFVEQKSNENVEMKNNNFERLAIDFDNLFSHDRSSAAARIASAVGSAGIRASVRTITIRLRRGISGFKTNGFVADLDLRDVLLISVIFTVSDGGSLDILNLILNSNTN